MTNSGTTSHNFTVVKLETGKTTDDVYTYYNAFFNGDNPTGTAPGQLVGGISDLAPGGSRTSSGTSSPVTTGT